MKIRTSQEDPITLHDGLGFVTKQDVAVDQQHTPAYIIEGSENHVLGIERNTPIAPEFRDVNGNKLDNSTMLIFQKADPQGNPLGNAIIFEDSLSAFEYDKMRSDPRYFKTTDKSVLIDEREFLHVYVVVPNGSNAIDTSKSRLTIGDNATQTGKPVFIRQKDSLNQQQKAALQQASSQ